MDVEGERKLYSSACSISMWGYKEGENNKGKKREKMEVS